MDLEDTPMIANGSGSIIHDYMDEDKVTQQAKMADEAFEAMEKKISKLRKKNSSVHAMFSAIEERLFNARSHSDQHYLQMFAVELRKALIGQSKYELRHTLENPHSLKAFFDLFQTSFQNDWNNAVLAWKTHNVDAIPSTNPSLVFVKDKLVAIQMQERVQAAGGNARLIESGVFTNQLEKMREMVHAKNEAKKPHPMDMILETLGNQTPQTQRKKVVVRGSCSLK